MGCMHTPNPHSDPCGECRAAALYEENVELRKQLDAMKKPPELPWKDVSSYSQGNKSRGGADATIWELVSGDIRVCVHRIIGCTGWFLTLQRNRGDIFRARPLGDGAQSYVEARAEGLRLSAYQLQEEATFLRAAADRLMELHTGKPVKGSKRKT